MNRRQPGPPDTPEARAHAAECETVLRKLREYIGGQAEDVHERDNRPALRVVPTLDQTGRVHMTIDQLAVAMGIERDELADDSLSLIEQL
jgi:hypothetical protein